jgi:hypothetical protein
MALISLLMWSRGYHRAASHLAKSHLAAVSLDGLALFNSGPIGQAEQMELHFAEGTGCLPITEWAPTCSKPYYVAHYTTRTNNNRMFEMPGLWSGRKWNLVICAQTVFHYWRGRRNRKQSSSPLKPVLEPGSKAMACLSKLLSPWKEVSLKIIG